MHTRLAPLLALRWKPFDADSAFAYLPRDAIARQAVEQAAVKAWSEGLPRLTRVGVPQKDDAVLVLSELGRFRRHLEMWGLPPLYLVVLARGDAQVFATLCARFATG